VVPMKGGANHAGGKKKIGKLHVRKEKKTPCVDNYGEGTPAEGGWDTKGGVGGSGGRDGEDGRRGGWGDGMRDEREEGG